MTRCRAGGALKLFMVWLAFAGVSLAQTTSNEPSFRFGPVEIYGRSGARAERVSVGHNLTIAEDETVREVVVVLGDLKLDGIVTDDLVVVLGDVTLGPNARVEREMVVVGGKVDMDPAATVGGERYIFSRDFGLDWMPGLKSWLRNGLLLGRPLPPQSGLGWSMAGGLFLLCLLLTLLMPGAAKAGVGALERRPVSSFFSGLLGFLLCGPLILLLIVSVVGVVAIPFLLGGMLLAILVGQAVLFQYAGRQVGHQVGLAFLRQPLIALFVGAAIFFLLYMVPVLGIMVWGLAVTVGFGAVVMAIFGSFRSEAPPLMPLATPTPPPPAASEVESSTGVVPLIRAGFWIRTLATLLDALLIGTLVAFTEAQPRLVIPIWAVYHLVMWTWKGTTIGGIVVGLKIVRRDGRPINFSVALVRCLSAFFSALVLLLGFFWAGWDREKQSWHDKIAGTTVVKVPKGAALM